MKYTAKVKQAQYVGTVKIVPCGGDLDEKQKAEIMDNPYGKDLIRKGYLIIEGVKPSDVEDKPKKHPAKHEEPKK
jgi:hypothetical protein